MRDGSPLVPFRTSRRDFLVGAGMGLLGCAFARPTGLLRAAPGGEPSAPVPELSAPRAKVGVIFSHISPNIPTWPQVGYDLKPGRRS